MLNVIEYGKNEYDFPALLVLGCFDAIHVGHRDLIKKAKLQAKINGLDLGVMLFRDGKGGKTVYSFEERLAMLEEFNVKFVLVVDYTDELKATAPLDFLHTVEEKVNVKAYMSGKDFRFGAGAKGKSTTLKNYAEDEDNGVWYMSVKDVMIGEEKISTTLIKQYLENGDIANANELLGSEFCVKGEVVKGAGRGASQLGYPTVNIVYPGNKYPVKYGVYAVKSTIGDTEYYGIANFGNCPTFGDERVALEVYFDSFNGDLYGQTLDIKFINYLRDIVAFASPEELKAQLNSDKTALQAIVAEQAKKAAEAAEQAQKPVEQPAPAAPVEKVAQQAQPAQQAEVSANEINELVSGFEEAVDKPAEETEKVAESIPETVVEVPVVETVEEKDETVEVAETIDEQLEEVREPEQPAEVVEEPAVEKQPEEDKGEDEGNKVD